LIQPETCCQSKKKHISCVLTDALLFSFTAFITQEVASAGPNTECVIPAEYE
jgi:hypothetical protein